MYGMTEEQFWNSNPRIIKVWEKAYKLRINTLNERIHSWVGTYGISALMHSIDHCLNGRKAKIQYEAKPMKMFELTEEEKQKEAEKARQAFVAWAGRAEKKYKKKGGE
jgi:hypothetical protein